MASDEVSSRPPSHARRRGASRLYTWVACTLAGVVGFALVYANTLISQLDGAYTPIDNSALISDVPEPTAPNGTTPAPTDAINILLMGSDDREGENGKIGGRVAKGMRNDTTIIMHISADRSRIDMVSIPRDAQVTIPECTLFDGTVVPGRTGDFNVSFANGGRKGNPAEAAACTINTVQKLTGLTIDHWMVADFTGFETMVDALGGVPMCIPERIVSSKANNLRLSPGPQILTGRQALGLARMRTAEVGNVSGSDLQRIARQHELLRQMSRVVLSKNLLTDAGELTQFLKAGASSLTMDPELANTTNLLGLAFSLRDLDTANINFYTIPWKYTEDFLNVIILDTASTMWAELRSDQPLTAFGDDSAGSTWDAIIDKSPQPVPSNTDAAQALLDECQVS